jgi:hypothetical protein
MYTAKKYKVQTSVGKSIQVATGNTPPTKVNDKNYSIFHRQTVEQ